MIARRADGPRAFLALIEPDRFEGLKRTAGHAAAHHAVAALADGVRASLVGTHSVRSGRSLVEVDFTAASVDDAHAALAAFAERVARRITIEGYGFDLSARIGFADSRGAPISEELIGLAERALDRARHGSAAIVLADPAALGVTVDRLSLMRGLQDAIRDDALSLFYQPKLRARACEIDAVEALVRWPQADGTMIPPDRFVPLAEETGDIRAMTEWVVDRAVRDQPLIVSERGPLRIYVNLSGCLLADARFTRTLLDRVAPTGGLIGFEITETAMIADPEGALANLRMCAEAGIQLAIDDYGSGFSSLSYLRQLPVDELKIDRAFIERLTTHQRDPLLVRSTIDLAHALEMKVTAEGVDSPHALALLQVMGCDLVQGFHLSRPLPLDALLAYIAAEPMRLAAPAPKPHRLIRRPTRVVEPDA